VERVLVLLTVPLLACGGVSYVEAPTAPAPPPPESDVRAIVASEPAAAVSSVPASIVVTPPSSAAPAPLSAGAVAGFVARTTSFYAAAGPFACDLNVETTDGARPPKAQAKTNLRLRLTFERPGKLQVAFSTGAVLVVNAGMLYLAEPTSRQLLQAPVAADYVPLAFAYAGASFGSRAAFTGYDGAVLNMPGYELVVGPPSAPALGVQKVLFFGDASGEVKRTMLIADKGERQRLDVIQCMMHIAPPPPSLFVPPSGPWAARTSASPLLGVP
jgi:hypothetical protein